MNTLRTHPEVTEYSSRLIATGMDLLVPGYFPLSGS
jgi:hypothetical protein